MSILDNNSPIRPEVPKAKRAANRLINMTKQTYNQMVQAFNEGSQVFWNNNGATPAEIATELGTDAKEVFELHSKLGQFIATIKPEAIIEGNSIVGNFILNEDGSVTVIVPELEPEEATTLSPE
jgi:hypothetical protein